jgi:hypothetical protein
MNDPKYQIGTKVKIVDTFRNGEIGFIEKITPGKNGMKNSYTVAFIGRQLATFSESGITDEFIEVVSKSIPARFDYCPDLNNKPLFYIVHEKTENQILDERKPTGRFSLQNESLIITVSNFAKGKDINILTKLCDDYPSSLIDPLKWMKDKGIGVLNTKKNGVEKELHWFFHPSVGAVIIKAVKFETIPRNKWIEQREVGMSEKKKIKKQKPNITYYEEKAGDNDGKPITRENLFDLFKLLPGPKIYTDTGIEITSQAVLECVNKVKGFIKERKVNEYFDYIINDEHKKQLKSNVEVKQFLDAVIAEGGITIIFLILVYDDLYKKN